MIKKNNAVILTEKQPKNLKLSTTVEKPGEVAVYYGFSPIDTLSINSEDVRRLKTFAKRGIIKDDKEAHHELQEKARLLRFYAEEIDAFPQHIFLYYEKPMKGGIRRHGGDFECGLDIIGSSKSSAEALLIETSIAILSEEGFENIEIALNTIGDRESIGRFERELTSYFRRHIEELPAVERQLFKKDIFEILRTENEKLGSFLVNAPQPLSTLSDVSREHFKEVLEFMESRNISYTIDNHLVQNKLYASQTVFGINGEKNGKRVTLGYGYRYNHLAKKIGLKKEIPAVGVHLFWKRDLKHAKPVRVKKIPKPKFYFIQLGYNAKLKSLGVIEILRKAKTPVYHALTKDKFSGQAATAENIKTPYVLIFGQKEALENTIVVRDAKTRFQDTIPLSHLPEYIKKFHDS